MISKQWWHPWHPSKRPQPYFHIHQKSQNPPPMGVMGVTNRFIYIDKGENLTPIGHFLWVSHGCLMGVTYA